MEFAGPVHRSGAVVGGGVVFLLEPDRTPYDLRFNLGDIPVRVHPMFWLFTALLGPQLSEGLPVLLSWILCVFVSILIHELGHVVVGRIFGADGSIVLYTFGGLAVGSGDVPRRWQRIAVAAAGPVAQFIIYGMFWGFVQWALGQRIFLSKMAIIMISQMLVINWYWPVLNLLPIWPLDGGRISRELLSHFGEIRGLRWSLMLSAGCACLLALNSLAATLSNHPLFTFFYAGGVYTILLFGSLAYSSYEMLQQLGPPSSPRYHDHSEFDQDGNDWQR